MANKDENRTMRHVHFAFRMTILLRSCSLLNWTLVGMVLTFGINSCTSPCDDCETTVKGSDFFPLEVGRFVEYDVNEEEVALGRPAVVRTFQWKEKVAESYLDPAGEKVYRIARFRRTLEGQPWTPDSTFTVRLKIDYAVRNESGRDYVKMVFPPSEKRSWNGNSYNHLGEDEYVLKDVNKALKIAGTAFDRTVTVVQQNDSTLVNQDKRIETYAAGVGLVYRERINVQFCSSTPSCIGKAQIDFGTRQFVRFKRTGME